ncbi:hypothetical protein MKX01_033946 [Papaver californicum]|nr:hypothetical protein MKX01_033946 [Papaver californicum]
MMGMGSALETLCGQAYGAGQHDMLGIYMQRSWVILNATSIILMFLYVFAELLLKLIGQDTKIAEAAGVFAIYMVPQSNGNGYDIICGSNSSHHIKLGRDVETWVGTCWGNASWWLIVVGQLVYIFSGTCGRAWSGFSWKAFQNLRGFVYLEVWFYMALILFAGYLKNPEVAVDALSTCMNILGWAVMVAIGFNAASSVRVSNELGTGHPRTAKFSVIVVVLSSFVLGLMMALVLITTRKIYPSVFTNSIEVKELIYILTPLLAFSIIIKNVQPVLSGVAIGAGWQALVAYVNIGCYYLFGISLGLIFGYKLDFGVQGIWCGMLLGTILQTGILFAMTYMTNWNREASTAGDRIRQWGGEPDAEERNNNKVAEIKV